ncbi:Argonaute complex, subunit Arb1 [Xylogone sp. PMI_703]|nr:Argonaute complex, subunit Arb1 [Xylogone sp. PMI_703]
MTPGDFYEEREFYTPDIPFHTRIQTCIQRYRGKRKLDSFRSNVFTKYLTLGGLDSSNTKAFGGGLDQDMVENSTTNEILEMQATDHIRVGAHNIRFYDPTDSENWVVDFEGVAKGFLSHTASRFIDMTSEASIKAVCAVIRNFLNYVLAHNVCLEHNDNVNAARKVCDLAEQELPLLVKFSGLIPGDLNKSISMICGGHYASLFASGNSELDDEEMNNSAKENLGISVRQAMRIFKTGIALSAPRHVFEKVMQQGAEITNKEMRYFEVCGIERANTMTIETYHGVKDVEGNIGNIKPLGVLKVRAWEGPGLEPEDMTDDEAEPEMDQTATEDFLLEEELLEQCFPGMKMQVVVGELNIGLKYIDSFMDVYPSFLVVLPNEKMFYWKDPGKKAVHQ